MRVKRKKRDRQRGGEEMVVLMKMYHGRVTPKGSPGISCWSQVRFFSPFGSALSFTVEFSSSATLLLASPPRSESGICSASLVLRREPMRIRDRRYIPEPEGGCSLGVFQPTGETVPRQSSHGHRAIYHLA